jgi:acyl-coenzyme A thioesterase PaaI-like protein
VIKPGRTLTVCSGEVTAIAGGKEKLIAVMQATMMAVYRGADAPAAGSKGRYK